MNGLSLFSGIGGIDIALAPWVTPVAYCEINPYCQAVLLSRMADGRLHEAPIWPDVRTLPTEEIPEVDIISGGFPCQDISVAGLGKGLAGERSGLVFEILRLAEQIRPTFVFLENVPAIRTRGAYRLGKELAALRYDCRWGVISAYDVGAPHLRERWFLLAHSNQQRREANAEPNRAALTRSEIQSRHDAHGLCDTLSHGHGHGHGLRQQPRRGSGEGGKGPTLFAVDGESRSLAHPESVRFGTRRVEESQEEDRASTMRASRWAVEPNVVRVAHGIPARVDRLRALGNAVVPLQAREAFKRLAGVR